MTKPLTVPAKLRQNVVRKASAYFKELEKAYIGKLKEASTQFTADIQKVSTFQPDTYTEKLKDASSYFVRMDKNTWALTKPVNEAVAECVKSLHSQLPGDEMAKCREAAGNEFKLAVTNALSSELTRMETTLFYPVGLAMRGGETFTVEAATENVKKTVDGFAFAFLKGK